MNEMEDAIRDALKAHRYEEADGSRLLDQVHARLANRRRLGWLAAGVATAAATAGLIVAITVIAPLGPDLDPLDARRLAASEPTTTSTPSPSPVPPGMQAVSFHGVEVLVPAEWTINTVRCSSPIADTVIIEDGAPQPACAYPQPPSGLTVVRLMPIESFNSQAWSELATESVTVSGHPASRGTGMSERSQTELAVLLLPGPGVAVTVESPDPAYADQVLDTVRAVAIDSVGCRDTLPTLVSQPDLSDADPLVPGSPASASICRYTGGSLYRSAAVPTTDVDDLVQILNALPLGVSTPGPGFFITPEACAEEPDRTFVIQLGYPDGSEVDVHVNLNGCKDIAATNGNRTTKLDAPLVDFLLGLVSYDGGFPKPDEMT